MSSINLVHSHVLVFLQFLCLQTPDLILTLDPTTEQLAGRCVFASLPEAICLMALESVHVLTNSGLQLMALDNLLLSRTLSQEPAVPDDEDRDFKISSQV